ncbi:MAG: hypothetical protein ACPK85_04990 [Methanosarcina sp.]
MKTKAIIAIALIISASLMAARVSPGIDKEQFREGKYIHIDTMEIQFNKTDADVNVKYHLSPFAEIYIFLFGSKHMEPKLEEIFFEFQDVHVQEIGQANANIEIKNIARKSDEFYLHDSCKFGVQPDSLTIIYPDGTRRNIEHPTATPPIFYE